MCNPQAVPCSKEPNRYQVDPERQTPAFKTLVTHTLWGCSSLDEMLAFPASHRHATSFQNGGGSIQLKGVPAMLGQRCQWP